MDCSLNQSTEYFYNQHTTSKILMQNRQILMIRYKLRVIKGSETVGSTIVLGLDYKCSNKKISYK